MTRREHLTPAQMKEMARRAGPIKAKKCLKCGESHIGGQRQMEYVEKCTTCGGKMMWLKNSKHDGEIR